MAAAVFAGCDAALALERTGEVALVEEPRVQCNLREQLVRLLEQLARCIEPNGGDVAPGRHVECLGEGALEAAHAQARLGGQVLKPQGIFFLAAACTAGAFAETAFSQDRDVFVHEANGGAR